MDDKISRRNLLKKTVAGVSTAAFLGTASKQGASWKGSPVVPDEEGIAPMGLHPAESSPIVPLTNTSDVYIPPRGIVSLSSVSIFQSPQFPSKTSRFLSFS